MTHLEAYSYALGRLVAGLLIFGAFAYSLGTVKRKQEERGPVHPKRVHRALRAGGLP